MACHLDGGSCPHDFGFGSGGSYLMSGSSLYSGGNYAGLRNYNPLVVASYATNPRYGVEYTTTDKYVSKITSTKNTAAAGRSQLPFENAQLFDQPHDVALPTKTIDDALDTQNAVAVQRNFLQQMIEEARQQTATPQQLQYMVMYPI